MFLERMDIMKKLTGSQTRQLFLDYFTSHGHAIEPGVPLVPADDPTLLWINAGVAALKKYFDGSIKPENPRITNVQKSIRTNDIENVGVTSRHHTFFEMLGNFSIGAYFKNEAIAYAWEFLTGSQWLDFDPEKLYITVHDRDEEAYQRWLELGVHPDHILKTPNNFWEIGEGPCGPDSEIFYDRGPDFDPQNIGEKLFFEEMENDRYVEIWNLVFSQYNARPGVKREDYEELPHKNIDTGMGLERICSIIQNGRTNFDTDLFLPIIEATQKRAKVSYQEDPMAYRVIADHIRTITFALGDGANFSNEGRGYVLRRILRRAVRYGQKIGISGSFMSELAAVVTDIMKDFYQELPDKLSFSSHLIDIEEEKFHQTLNDGEKMLGGILATGISTLSGQDAFRLYDTYGFPLELTLEICQEHHVYVDEAGFHEEMNKQKETAKKARTRSESMQAQNAALMDFTTPSVFHYDPAVITGDVIAIFVDGSPCEQLEEEGDIILDETPFYAEMGGQVADTGQVYNDDFKARVTSVINTPNKQHMLHLDHVMGTLSLHDTLTQKIDLDKRRRTQRNHTATHLLQRALKNVVGDHISQAGSYVDDQRLRFDFTHFEKLSAEQLEAVERQVNEAIFAGMPVTTAEMPIEEARATGATALFTEKYGKVVRVVSIADYSKEFCGGTHVKNTADIGLFKLVSEESIGSGIRRIEGITGEKAYRYFHDQEKLLNQTAAILKAGSSATLLEKADEIMADLGASKKEIQELTAQLNAYKAQAALSQVETVNGIRFLSRFSENDTQNALKQEALSLRDHLGSGVVLLMSKKPDRLAYYVAVSPDLVAKGIRAGDLVKAANAACGGKGGGKPDFAQGGGKDATKAEAVIAQIQQVLL